MKKLRWLFAAVIAVAAVPAASLAQEAATITGRVTNEAGEPIAAATVSITSLNVGTQTGPDGTYRLVVPASRINAAVGVVPLTATRVGFASRTANVTLEPGAEIVENFQLGTDVLQLEGIVATGQGTQTTRERVTAAISTVQAEEIVQSNEVNVVSALAAKAPGVNITSSSGDPGAGAYIRIRGAASIVAGTQPLFVVDGTPVDNSTNSLENPQGQNNTGGTALANRATDINPNDIQRVEILKGAAATAIYGSRGANGVVLITTKQGQAGSTRATLSSSFGFDEVTQLPELQTQFGRGSDAARCLAVQFETVAQIQNCVPSRFRTPAILAATTREELVPLLVGYNINPTNVRSYGPALPDSLPVFNHAEELYDTGLRFENNLTLSGGSDQTTYYLGVGRSDVDGTIRGNQSFDRTSARLKGSHFFADNIQVSGNVAYVQSGGDLVQQGSNTSGILLGALRTPPEFNNLPFRDPVTGLQRSYRVPNPEVPNQSSGFDNPFFVANENLNTTDVGRVYGNVALDYAPSTWLKFNYTLGADYSNDERSTLFPQSSAGAPLGQVIEGTFTTRIIDSNLSATASGSLNDRLIGSVTVGQNLNQEEFNQLIVTGQDLILGAAQPDFTVTRTPDQYEYTQRTDGYFITGETTLDDQLTLTATGRLDGSSTFGGDGERFFYPSVGASWVFSKLPAFDNVGFLDFGKLRASYGQAGRQPPVFSDVSGFNTGLFNDGYVAEPGGLNSIYAGQQGIFSRFRLGNDEIAPEVKTEYEFGLDLAFLQQRASLGVTYFTNKTEDVILDAPLSPSTGFFNQYRNAAEFEGDGWEVSLDLVPVQTDKVNWTVGAQWSTANTCVTDLAGAEDVFLAGFTGSTVSLVAPGVAGTSGCNPFGVFFGQDFVRFGRGTNLDLDGDGTLDNIDAAFPQAQEGALFIAENGFPIIDDQYRVVGDPNPDWTGALRSSLSLFDNLRISGLLDIKHGGQVWNGTKGALISYGTSAESLPYHGLGFNGVVGTDVYADQAVAGPGAGNTVTFNETFATGIGSGFNGPFSQFLEDGGYVKLRDVSVSYTLEQPWLERLGFNTVDFTVSGRNLHTWTDYTGIDPESNLTGASTGRGLDYFNNPQTRSYIFSVNLNR